jgi:drug/metabolite transporter (DMT)-like permease
MDAIVFTAVLAAAAMHAGWNAVVKVGLDRLSAVLLLALVQGGMAACLLPFAAAPAAAAWPWIAASAALHTGYKVLLVRAYAHGELSQVYPIARGAALLLVAVVGAGLLGEPLQPVQWLALTAIALGVVMMSVRGGALLGTLPRKALLNALGTAAFTACYTLVDGIGARLAGTPTGFTLWMFAADGLLMLMLALCLRGPSALTRLLPEWKAGVTGGALSLGSYWIAVWAFTLAPIALVAALRETSVLFAMIIAVVLLREEAGSWRWLAALLILAGAVLLRV